MVGGCSVYRQVVHCTLVMIFSAVICLMIFSAVVCFHGNHSCNLLLVLVGRPIDTHAQTYRVLVQTDRYTHAQTYLCGCFLMALGGDIVSLSTLTAALCGDGQTE